ncbi:saccharopine dehydrogenase (NADP+, L-glutamate forming) [Streptomyces sp. yr375]|uniref:saccharopine dehydrogenase family protein n=1 Tax=Streptomyces sp. yr375 TaxID=1761906 RepID=UPI0008D6E30B|nr:saccharopine dehydrogenase family protein [Streptomyces sp. yr375]SES04914.1 saccharopine dehydrogenase (NADP+, L-glutamate forming) [Streptomyces sp. yr375]
MSEPTPTPAPVPASGTVHWIGTGLSTGRTGLGLLREQAGTVLLWGRTEERAAARIAELGLTGTVSPRAFDHEALAAEVRPGDVVVSMLPATEHPALLRLCLDAGAHFACSSYVSDALREGAQDAARAGLVVLTEAGLDPGIDHLLAHRLVADARAALGDSAEDVVLTSYCGGIPAEPNDFRYRFSWAPYGVLAALGSPARYIEDGAERTAPRPWEATRELRLGGEEFEVYPNRDSVPFVAQYGVPDGWRTRTFVRGTLRNAGWRQAWEPVFATVRGGDQAEIAALAKELADRYPTTPADRDRVVLAVALTARTQAGESWRGEYVLDLTGTEQESAMARCVSLPLALGITRVLAGALPAGLNRAAEDPAEAARWLTALAGHGLRPAFHS